MNRLISNSPNISRLDGSVLPRGYNRSTFLDVSVSIRVETYNSP